MPIPPTRSEIAATVARVAAGAIAKKILNQEDIEILAYTLELGGIRAEKIDYEENERNFLRCAAAAASAAKRPRESGSRC